MENLEIFKAELKASLAKHNASISCNVDGDTHGLTYEMSVDFRVNGKWKEYKLCNGAGIDSSDI